MSKSAKQSTKQAPAVVEPVAAPEPTPAAVLVVEPVATAKPSFRGNSTVHSPVARMWHLCDRAFYEARENGQPHPRRKDLVALAQSQGIAYYTARTQYQAWFRATNSGTQLIAERESSEGISRGIAAIFFPAAS